MGYRKDYLDAIEGRRPEHFPATEYMMFWPECLPDYCAKAGTEDLSAHFGLGRRYAVPCNFNPGPAFEEVILAETDTHITKIDAVGVTCMMEKGTSAMPHFIDFPIKDRASFLEYKKRLDPMTPERLGDLDAFAAETARSDGPTEMIARGPFAFLRDLMPFETMMMTCCDDPDLIREMTEFHADFLIRLWGRVFDKVIPDFLYFGEDMAYKTGSMISPAMIEDYIFPAWKKIIDFCKSRGCRHFILDSDGRTTDILPIAVRAGFDVVLPVERAAGMDAEVIRESWPGLAVIGGVDKLELAKGHREIDREVEKAARLYRKGKYIPSVDHSVPPIVSYENYKYYIEALKEACR